MRMTMIEYTRAKINGPSHWSGGLWWSGMVAEGMVNLDRRGVKQKMRVEGFLPLSECWQKQRAFSSPGSLGDFYRAVGLFLSFGEVSWILMAVNEWPWMNLGVPFLNLDVDHGTILNLGVVRNGFLASRLIVNCPWIILDIFLTSVIKRPWAPQARMVKYFVACSMYPVFSGTSCQHGWHHHLAISSSPYGSWHSLVHPLVPRPHQSTIAWSWGIIEPIWYK
jgi:hypothetical protein